MLRATAAFSAASPLAMAELVAAARMRVIEAGEYLFRHGDPSDAVYVIVEGLLAVFSQLRAEDVDEPLVCLGPGELVGEMQIIFGGRRSASASALDFGPLQEIAKGAYEYSMTRLRDLSPPREGV
jgi:CRP-like cAMP-binding protein